MADNAELAINELFTKNSDFTAKQNRYLTDTIYNIADKYSGASTNLDRDFKKYFPEIEKYNDIPITEKFNPEFCFEFKDGKAIAEYKDWDKDYGILPDRRVVGSYYIDIGVEVTNDMIEGAKREDKYIFISSCNCIWKINKVDKRSTFSISNAQKIKSHNDCNCNIYYNNYYTVVISKSPKSNNSGWRLSNCSDNDDIISIRGQCGEYFHTKQNITTNLFSVKRGEDRPPFKSISEIKFEVDNYLNLYHPETGLYLMLNKTPFPFAPFHLYDNKMFKSRRYFQLDFNLSKDYYKLLDSRDELLTKINNLIPENYLKVYETFNNFRKFPKYSSVDDVTIKTEEITEVKDPKDKLIEELKERLQYTVKKADAMEEHITKMMEEYQSHSNSIKDLERQLVLKDKKIAELETEMKLNTVSEIEKLKTELFSLNKVIVERDNIELKNESINKSLKSIKDDNDKLTLSIEKQKDINNGLIAQIKSLKKANTDLRTQNNQFTNDYQHAKSKLNSMEIIIKKKKTELEEKQLECDKLINGLQVKGDKSQDALEQALSQQLETITDEKKIVTDKYNELVRENKELQCKLEKFTKTLNSLL